MRSKEEPGNYGVVQISPTIKPLSQTSNVAMGDANRILLTLFLIVTKIKILQFYLTVGWQRMGRLSETKSWRPSRGELSD